MDENVTKRYAYICQPLNKFTAQRYKAIAKQLSEDGYDVLETDEHFSNFKDMMIGFETLSSQQFVLGVSIVLMSACQAVFFPKKWEDDPLLKDLYLIAFKYGMHIVVER